MARSSPSRSVVVRRVVERAAPIARRVGGAAARAAWDEKHTLTALGAAGAAGYLRREGRLDEMWHVEAIGPEGTYGAIAWAIARWTKNKTASHVATGLLCVAVNRYMAEPSAT